MKTYIIRIIRAAFAWKRTRHRFSLLYRDAKLWIKRRRKYRNRAFFDSIKGKSKTSTLAKIVSVQGFMYSGSGVIPGLLGECDNVYVMGVPDYNFTKNKLSNATVSECFFFEKSNFFTMVKQYGKGTAEERDILIKSFIQTCRTYVEMVTKQPLGFESAPELFNEKFEKTVHHFLLQVLEMDETTREYMKGKKYFPTTVDPWYAHLSTEWQWEKLSFAHYWGNRIFIVYDFKKMAQDELNTHVSNFLSAFFSLLPNSPCTVYDQLMPGDIMEQINFYLHDSPVKQLCVWRDPRDRYMDVLNYDTWGWSDIRRDVNSFCKAYLSRLMSMKSNPNRLFIRFEDIVLKYGETRDRIFNFIGMDLSHQITPQSVFDPNISVKNIGRWRLYPNQGLMQRIEEKMGHSFCFYPEKHNLSAQAWELLKSSGNWDSYNG